MRAAGALSQYLKTADVIHCPSTHALAVGRPGILLWQLRRHTGFDARRAGRPFDRIITRRPTSCTRAKRFVDGRKRPARENSAPGDQLNGTPAMILPAPPLWIRRRLSCQSCTFSWQMGTPPAEVDRHCNGQLCQDSDPSGSKYGNPPSEASTIHDITFVSMPTYPKIIPEDVGLDTKFAQ